jgi:nucleotide-binding universal stress UspA family protein
MGFNGYMDMGSIQRDSAEGLKDASIHYLDKIKTHLKDDTIQTLVREGEFADAILKAAKEVHADIIVIGSHSQKWLEKIVMGSVTEKVLNHTTLPLFVVPTKRRK